MPDTTRPEIDRAAIITELTELARQSVDGDRETAHREADGTLCGLLCDLGFEDVVVAYHGVQKWFA